jgi:cell division protein FtsN
MMVGVLLGLLLGVVVAFFVAWYVTKTPVPYLNRKPQAEKPAEAKGSVGAPQQPIALPGKPGEKAGEKPRFEFYKILPGAEEAKSGQVEKPEQKPEQKAPPAATETFFLQAGSFQNADDADNLKARLALLGLEASVQQADVPDKGRVFRVRLGPYRKPEDMNNARSQLAQNGIPATVIRGKDVASR